MSAAAAASRRRNRQRSDTRHIRWRPARAALLRFLERHAPITGNVLVVGAGNCDDIPLEQLAGRAERVDLLDHDPTAPCEARLRLAPALARRTRCLQGDLTHGWSDQIIAAAVEGRELPLTQPEEVPSLGEGPYDLVIGDLIYSQLLYPALADAELEGALIDRVCRTAGPPLVRFVVERLHAASRSCSAVHLHDPLLWTPGRKQPVSRREVLMLAQLDQEAARALISRGYGPKSFDPRAALLARGATIEASAFWRWPFVRGTDYLVEATVATIRPPLVLPGVEGGGAEGVTRVSI